MTMSYLQISFLVFICLEYLHFSHTALTTLRICENREAKINCSMLSIISIEIATYGRIYGRPCPHPTVRQSRNYTCVSVETDVIRSKCQMAVSCSISPSNRFFGKDPCPGLYKYLEIQYQCLAVATTDENTFTPPSMSGKKSEMSGIIGGSVGGILAVIVIVFIIIFSMQRLKCIPTSKSRRDRNVNLTNETNTTFRISTIYENETLNIEKNKDYEMMGINKDHHMYDDLDKLPQVVPSGNIYTVLYDDF